MPIKKTLVLTLAASAVAMQAHAGGFSRGTADTDILYEDGNFTMRTGVTIAAPQRGYETITIPVGLPGAGTTINATDPDFTQTYIIPTAAIKFNIGEDLRCAGTFTESFGGDVRYGPQGIAAGIADGSGQIQNSFSANEFGVTCGYKFDLGKGRAWIIGGLFGEDITYEESARLPTANALSFGNPNAVGTLKFDGGYKLGYRAGVAYEIQEIALRGQVLYRSGIDHAPGGTLTVVDSVAGTVLASLPATAAGSLPQSVEVKLQSGIAPGWLAFGSVKWTDWSVLDRLDYTIFTPGGPVPTGLEFYWQDGWTVTAGIGHKFNDYVTGALSLTWDRGVSTTEDALTDTWTLGAGAVFTDKMGGQLRLAGGISYLTSASVAAQTPGPVPFPNPGHTFAYTVGNDWAFAGSASYRLNW